MGAYINRRNFLHVSGMSILAFGLSSCSQIESLRNAKKETLWKNLPASTKGLYGFIDESGKWYIEPQFKDFCFFFDTGNAPVICERKLDEQSESIFYSGIINMSGHWVKEPRENLYFGDRFSEGLVGVTQIQKESGYPGKGDLGGYMDIKGHWVIDPKFDLGSNRTPLSFEKSDLFIRASHAKALKAFGKNKDLVYAGVIDKKGNWIIEPKFRSIDWDSFYGDLTVGLALAQDTGNKENSLWGFIDGKGSWKIPPVFKEGYTFIGDYAEVVDNKTGLHGAINQNGEWVLSPKFSELFYINQTYCTAKDPQSEFYGVLDFSTDEWMVEPRWKEVRRLSTTAVVAQDADSGYTGVYSAVDGSTILAAQYSDVIYAEDKPFIAVQDRETNLWGLVDTNGVWHVKPTYKEVSYFSKSSLLPAQDPETELYGYIDISGEWVIQPAYRQVSDFYAGLASVSSNT